MLNTLMANLLLIQSTSCQVRSHYLKIVDNFLKVDTAILAASQAITRSSSRFVFGKVPSSLVNIM